MCALTFSVHIIIVHYKLTWAVIIEKLLSHFHYESYSVIFGGGGRETEGEYFIFPSIVDSVYASQHCVAFVQGATQTNKNQFSRENIRALDTIQREYWLSQNKREKCMKYSSVYSTQHLSSAEDKNFPFCPQLRTQKTYGKQTLFSKPSTMAYLTMVVLPSWQLLTQY